MFGHRRFFVDFPPKEKEPVLLKEKKLLHQLKNVLRLKKGDKIILLDNSQNEYETEILRVFDNQISGLVRKKIEPEIAAPQKRISLYQALIRDKRLKLVFEKGTELGVFSFIPLQTRYSLKKNTNYERMKRIVKEAAEQSGRKKVPEIGEMMSFEKAIVEAADGKNTLNLLFHEKGEQFSLKNQEEAQKFDNINIFIGPEGGFSEKEIGLAKNNNFRVVKIGDLILRSETAAIGGLAIIQAILPR